MSTLLSVRKLGPKKWVLASHPLYRDDYLTISWLQFLPVGVGTKHQREYLRKSARQFFSQWVSYMEGGKKRISPSTVRIMFTRLKTFTLWMISQEIWRFSSLSQGNLNEFLLSRNSTIHRDSAAKQGVSKSVTKSYITMLSLMWSFRGNYHSPIRFDASRSIEFDDIMLSARPRQRWMPVEISTAVSLLRTACGRMDNRLSLEETALKLWHGSRGLVGKTSWQRRASIEVLVKDAELEYAGASDVTYGTYTERGVPMDISDVFKEFVGVCLIVILFFSGMRISEALSLRSDCLVQRLHSNGKRFWYLRGIAAKKGGVERLWVVPGVVVEFVQLLEKIFRNIRELYKVENLFLARIWRTSQITGKLKPRPLGTGSAAYLLKQTIHRIYTADPNLSKQFHPHRARKTFAKFVVLRDKSSLESIAHHYGHIYAATLDSQYVGNDFNLEELIHEEDAVELRRGLLELLSSDNLGGKAGERLADLRNDQTSEIFKGKISLESLVDRMIKGGVILAPCDWGFCVYARDLSLCGGNQSGPDLVQRAPTICASCSNFAVTDRHIPWWERRVSDAEDFLQHKSISAQTRRLVEDQMQKSRLILTKLIRRGGDTDGG